MTTNRGYNPNEIRQAKGMGNRIWVQFNRMLRKNPNMIVGLFILMVFSFLTIFADF